MQEFREIEPRALRGIALSHLLYYGCLLTTGHFGSVSEIDR